MAKRQAKAEPEPLRGWKQIAAFLGQPQATAQHWAKEGMPVRRQGRSVTASREELSGWLERESGAGHPVRIAGNNDDLTADLRRGLAAARQHHGLHRVK